MMATLYEVPSELAQAGHHHLVLAATDQDGWTVWYSRWRAEWDYAVALREAAENVVRRATGGGSTPPSRNGPGTGVAVTSSDT